MIYPYGFVEILGSGIASGYILHPYHYMELFNGLSGVERILGLNVAGTYPTVDDRISNVENLINAIPPIPSGSYVQLVSSGNIVWNVRVTDDGVIQTYQ